MEIVIDENNRKDSTVDGIAIKELGPDLRFKIVGLLNRFRGVSKIRIEENKIRQATLETEDGSTTLHDYFQRNHWVRAEELFVQNISLLIEYFKKKGRVST